MRPTWRRISLTCLAAAVLVILLPVASSASVSQRWVKRYTVPGFSFDAAASIAVSPDNSRVFVTGPSVGRSSSFDYATIAYDATVGTQLWAKRYNGPGDAWDFSTSVETDPDGSTVYVTGRSQAGSGTYDYATIAYDAVTGTRLWVSRFGGSGRDDEATSLAVGPAGARVYVTGGSVNLAGDSDYATVAYDASSGAQLWVKRYQGEAKGSDRAVALGVSPDGSKIVVTGTSFGSTTFLDYATVAYARSGGQLWVKRYSGPGNQADDAVGLVIGPDGSRAFVTGSSAGSTSGDDYATIAYGVTSGQQLWVARYDGAAGGFDSADAIGISPDGAMVVVTGTEFVPSTVFDYGTVAYDASSGHQLWATLYNGDGDAGDLPTSVQATPDGSQVIVTGESWGGGTGEDYATLGYDPSSGSQLWVKRYNGQGNDFDRPTGMAVSPNGKAVFVTGDSVGSVTFDDFATVAYRLS
jgi:hypothetical protein